MEFGMYLLRGRRVLRSGQRSAQFALYLQSSAFSLQPDLRAERRCCQRNAQRSKPFLPFRQL